MHRVYRLVVRTPSPGASRRAVLEEHFDLALAVNAGKRSAEAFTGRNMRKFGVRFAEHHPRGDEVRREFLGVSRLADWQSVLHRFYGAELRHLPGGHATPDPSA